MGIVLRGNEPPKLAGCMPPIIAEATSGATAGTKVIEATGRFMLSYLGPAHQIIYAKTVSDSEESMDNNVQITKVIIDGKTIFTGQAAAALVGFLHQFASQTNAGNPGYAQASSAVFGEGGFLIEQSIEVWARYINSTPAYKRKIAAVLSPIE
ncbi:hypothetical protein EGI94_00125 [Stutzerimonas stutzeri]|uniref:hypothetical protein n=1 Tax=Stutzerimonas stutzeri TaxID=316 RepID=UPI000F77AB8A|nr:hypothetical protein [Stutzerimonas stutzeri]RRV35553.1 hypothetical protein EGI94_00125 [Stutzerimonas stutzeri]